MLYLLRPLRAGTPAMMPGQIAKFGNSAAQLLLGGLAALRSFGTGEKDSSAVGDDSRQDIVDLRDAV